MSRSLTWLIDDCGRKRKSDSILTRTFSDASSESEISFKNQNYLNQIRGLSGNSRVDRTNHFPADIPMNRLFVSRRKFSTAGRMPRHRQPNLGFTLVELLVSVSIIGLLSGMLLPAVQMIRESARRSSCANNLKNLGLGLLSYESAHRSFPHGSNFGTEFSWGAKILPWLEQKTLHDQIDWWFTAVAKYCLGWATACVSIPKSPCDSTSISPGFAPPKTIGISSVAAASVSPD